MHERILFVDDDPNVLDAYQRKLHGVLEVHTALGPHVALREIEQNGPFAVVVSDMRMPQMNGVEFLGEVKKIAPESVRIMLTGEADVRVAMDAVNSGSVFRFLTKPCPPKEMGEALVSAIAHFRLIASEKHLLEGTLQATTELLSEILSWVCPDAFGNSLLVRHTVSTLARRLNAADIWQIEIAAALSQIGMLSIPAEITAKSQCAARLTPSEHDLLECVPSIGYELLGRIPRLEEVAKIVFYAQKHFDGTGFPPDDVAQDRIPLGSRILKLVSDYHALRASGLDYDEALNEIVGRKGWYDPDVVRVFRLTVHDPLLNIPPEQIRTVRLNDLTLGNILVSPIRTQDGHKLLGAGAFVTSAILMRLHHYALVSRIEEPIEIVAI